MKTQQSLNVSMALVVTLRTTLNQREQKLRKRDQQEASEGDKDSGEMRRYYNDYVVHFSLLR